MHEDQTLPPKKLKEIEFPINTASTTRKFLNENQNKADDKLWYVIKHNMDYIQNMVEFLGKQPHQLRMVRLGSDILPLYTEDTWGSWFKSQEVQQFTEQRLATIGARARELDCRLSMHPGQFTVLASDTPDIVNNSIKEMEYHTDIARMMGYGSQWQDFKINVHISGRLGPDGIKAVLPRLSSECRNCMTIENDEMKWGLEDSLELENDVALVLDIHHHFIRSGEYIQTTDDRFKRVVDSWRGQRPVIHYSVSREDVLVDHDPNILPDMETLLAQGYKKTKLRAHSDYFWNHAVNNWAKQFYDHADIMCESKAKNLASFKFYKDFIDV